MFCYTLKYVCEGGYVLKSSLSPFTYAKNKKCHDIEPLNCYLCACPNFRFFDGGIGRQEDAVIYSECAISSKDGKQELYGDKIHQNCSLCDVPHKNEYVKKIFNTNWREIMSGCEKIGGEIKSRKWVSGTIL